MQELTSAHFFLYKSSTVDKQSQTHSKTSEQKSFPSFFLCVSVNILIVNTAAITGYSSFFSFFKKVMSKFFILYKFQCQCD